MTNADLIVPQAIPFADETMGELVEAAKIADTSPEDLAAKRPALVWKHVVLLVVYGGGSWWAWAMVESAARV